MFLTDIVLFHSPGVSEKEGGLHLASKALMKKSTDRNIKYKESAIIETAAETMGTQPQVKTGVHVKH